MHTAQVSFSSTDFPLVGLDQIMLSIWYNGFDFLLIRSGDIGSSKKKVCHIREEKMQKRKKKMILQIDEYLV